MGLGFGEGEHDTDFSGDVRLDTTGGEGFGEIEDVSVQIIRMAKDVPPQVERG